MAGLAAFIGGAGQGIERYRNILESRREALASHIAGMAAQEQNPTYKSQMIQAVGDLYSGKPLHQVLPNLSKTVQSQMKDHALIAQAIPQQGQPPQVPGPSVGKAPGMGTNPAPTAMPPSSPVSPEQQSTQGIMGQYMGGIIPQQEQTQQSPVTVTPQVQPQPVPALSPIPSDPRAMRQGVIQKYQQLRNQTPSAFWNQIDKDEALELQSLLPFEQQAMREQQFNTLMGGLNELRSRPGYNALESIPEVSALFQRSGYAPPSMMPMRAMVAGYSTPSTGASLWKENPQLAQEHGIANDNSPITIRRNNMSNEIMAVNERPVRGYVQSGYDPTTGQAMYMLENPYSLGQVPSTSNFTPAPAAVNTPRNVSMSSGQIGAITPAGELSGLTPRSVPGTVASTAPTTTVSPHNYTYTDPNTGQQVQGVFNLPTTRTKGQTQQQAGPPQGSSGTLTVPAQGGYPELSMPIPKGASLAPGQAPPSSMPSPVMSLPKTLPTQLTAAGQQGVTAIDQVLSQIGIAKSEMDKAGWKNDDTHSYYPDFVKYMHGGYSSPYQSIYTNLSFEAIRSAAAALKGVNSRAYQIITRALDHTPNLSLSVKSLKASDTPKTIYGKLDEMEKLLSDGRNQIMKDEQKSGVVPSQFGAPPSKDSLGIR